ncbi:9178_t:CDS:2, partial [Gigaspora margarita]
VSGFAGHELALEHMLSVLWTLLGCEITRTNMKDTSGFRLHGHESVLGQI